MYGVGKEQRITTRYTEERGKCIYSKGGAGERMDTCFFVEAVTPAEKLPGTASLA